MAKETISQTEGLCKEVTTCIRIAYEKGYKQGQKDAAKSEYEHDHAVVKAYNDGQTFILNKIRAEIASEILPFEPDTYNGIVNLGITTALAIIDKYKSESEE